MSNAPKQLQNAKVSIFSLNSTGAVSALGVVQLDSTGGIVSGGAGGGSTQVSVKEILTSSGASVMDSTEGAIKVNVVAGAAGGSTEVTVRQSTVGALRAAVYQSTAADLSASVVQGSTVWAVQLSQYSTTVNVSSLGGAVIVRSSAADFAATVSGTVRSTNSVAGDFHATVAPASTVWAVQARPVTPTFASVYSTVLSTASTAFYEVVSSAAGLTRCVTAERVTSTAITPMLVEFKQSTGTTVWHAEVGSGSSGITGANVAQSWPSRLFQSSAAGNLMVRLTSTGQEVRISLAYFSE